MNSPTVEDWVREVRWMQDWMKQNCHAYYIQPHYGLSIDRGFKFWRHQLKEPALYEELPWEASRPLTTAELEIYQQALVLLSQE